MEALADREVPETDWVILEPTTAAPDRDAARLRELLEGRTVRRGESVEVTFPDGRTLDFTVANASPKGASRVAFTTRLMLQPAAAGGVRRVLTYADVGGLKPQLGRVREVIELPLRFPEVFERLGIAPPKGVLLHGPPGCGKTLIARAVSHEIDASFYSVSGPEIIHHSYGESEAHLRNLFEEATRTAPSVLFLDEIDAIAPSRERVQGEVEKRVVAQLLALMDGLAPRRQVIVLAATNRPNALDPALRRPGRFDREIMIPVPDRAGRREILELHSLRMPLAEDVDVGHLAAVTHGFVGADLEALCREAAMSRLRRILPRIDLDLAEIPAAELDALEVTMDDFLAALHEVQPSALREVAIEVPNVPWDAVGGLAGVKARLRAVFEWPLAHPELFAAAAVRPTKGILLHGPPGCGKTLLARALASESGVNFISVKGPELLSMYVGESEERVRDVFRKARLASPSIVFFDEIDALFSARQAAGEARTAERLLSQLLAELDGIEELKDVLVLGATNRVDLLDPALLRPDRFDEVIAIPLPDLESRREIFAVQLRDKPLAAAADVDALARRAEGWSGAEIAEAVRRAALRAIARLLDGEAEPDPEALRITADDLTQAMDDVRPGTLTPQPPLPGGEGSRIRGLAPPLPLGEGVGG
ncbi:MAG TPA: AAA family ATPase [Thermoanaerobaculia bacterium]